MQSAFKNKLLLRVGLAFSILAVPVLIYVYFLRWKTTVIYGDDLSVFTQYLSLGTLYEKIVLPLGYGKYRPVNSALIGFLINTFNKSMGAYYLFNILVQALITFSLALIVNLFFKSRIYSVFVGLAIGLSRFAFFNVTQLFNGGALEGAALVFFLLCLFFILRVLVKDSVPVREKVIGIALSLLFGNIAMYTHERYIVLMPFVLLVLFVPRLLTGISRGQRLILAAAAGLSIVVNVLIKKYVFGLPFFVGTGGSNITVSFDTIAQFAYDGILSIMNINSGPDYLAGIPFSKLDTFDQAIVIIVCVICAFYLFAYLAGVVRKRQPIDYSNRMIFALLFVLFVFLLAPSVMTIRLEQRWLQGPLAILVVMLVVAVTNLKFGSKNISKVIFAAVVILSIRINYAYLDEGAGYLYLSSAETMVRTFWQAIDDRTISAGSTNLYVWEKKKNKNFENEIKWYLIDGAFFEFYQNKPKKVLFIDSSEAKINIDRNSDQIVYPDGNHMIDITEDYINDTVPARLKDEDQ